VLPLPTRARHRRLFDHLADGIQHNHRDLAAAGEERTRLWQEALKFWPPYADYQLKTKRPAPRLTLDKSEFDDD
jgi:F420H(2)-dependent quinone reductase